MFNETNNNKLPLAVCNAIYNDEYKKLASQTIVTEKGSDTAIFEFIIEYPKYEFTVFLVKTKFENDKGDCRIMYMIDSTDSSVINLIGYNTDDDKLCNSTIYCDMRKIITIDDKDFYIKPKITMYRAGIKEITIDLFVK